VHKVVAIVDGLNLFHALKALNRDQTNIDIVGLSKRILSKTADSLVSVEYYSAPVEHLSEKVRADQRRYIDLLTSTGVIAKMGNFKRKTITCPRCGGIYFKHEEKETDVNIALAIARVASSNEVDKVLLFSADTDLIPVIKLANQLNPKIEIYLVSTVQYLRNIYASMAKVANGQFRLTAELVASQLFED
jgi:uncharacterized LabA/DUF88 family protein